MTISTVFHITPLGVYERIDAKRAAALAKKKLLGDLVGGPRMEPGATKDAPPLLWASPYSLCVSVNGTPFFRSMAGNHGAGLKAWAALQKIDPEEAKRREAKWKAADTKPEPAKTATTNAATVAALAAIRQQEGKFNRQALREGLGEIVDALRAEHIAARTHRATMEKTLAAILEAVSPAKH